MRRELKDLLKGRTSLCRPCRESHEERIESAIVGHNSNPFAILNLMRRELKVPHDRGIRLLRSESHEERIESFEFPKPTHAPSGYESHEERIESASCDLRRPSPEPPGIS